MGRCVNILLAFHFAFVHAVPAFPLAFSGYVSFWHISHWIKSSLLSFMLKRDVVLFHAYDLPDAVKSLNDLKLCSFHRKSNFLKFFFRLAKVCG